jgi:hypothetical protein
MPVSQSSDLLYDWRFTANQFLAASPLRPTTKIFIFQLNTNGYGPYITSSLTRGWVCLYSCCWASPAQSFSGPSITGLITTFYCLRFETLLTWRTRSSCIPPEHGGPVIPPGIGFPFRRLHRGSISLESNRSLRYDRQSVGQSALK